MDENFSIKTRKKQARSMESLVRRVRADVLSRSQKTEGLMVGAVLSAVEDFTDSALAALRTREPNGDMEEVEALIGEVARIVTYTHEEHDNRDLIRICAYKVTRGLKALARGWTPRRRVR